jgi:ligand-binding sensor protein
VDAKRIKNLLTSFYEITGIPSTLIDLDGNILTTADGSWIAAGWQDICLNFHRKHPETLKKCVESDTKLSNGLRAGEKYSCYSCRNGLVDMAVPVYIGGKHLANLFTGQFLFESPDKEFFKKQAEEYGFDEDEYLKTLSKVPVFSKEFINKGMGFLTNLASVI